MRTEQFNFVIEKVTMYVIIFITILLILFMLFQKFRNSYCISEKRLDNKTVIVTGGTAGIGLEIAKDLSKRGAKLIIACPFNDEGKEAEKDIKEYSRNQNVTFKHLNLASLESVRKFAEDIKNNEDRLDILINNAGIGVPEDTLTEDGMNLIMQVNYYGTFLLTLLLLPMIRRSAKTEKARIITTASILHWFGCVDVANLNRTNYWYKVQLYANSKMCLVHFANELSKKLKGTNVVINNVDPGLVSTKIYESVNYLFGVVVKVLLTIFFKTPFQGAQTTLHAALDDKEGCVSGAYFKNCGISRLVRSADENTSSKLWEQSVRLAKLTESELEQCFY